MLNIGNQIRSFDFNNSSDDPSYEGFVCQAGFLFLNAFKALDSMPSLAFISNGRELTLGNWTATRFAELL